MQFDDEVMWRCEEEERPELRAFCIEALVTKSIWMEDREVSLAFSEEIGRWYTEMAEPASWPSMA